MTASALSAERAHRETLFRTGTKRPAMQLALELMKRGSDQVAMSDEALMAGDMEGSLSVVIGAGGRVARGRSDRTVLDDARQ